MQQTIVIEEADGTLDIEVRMTFIATCQNCLLPIPFNNPHDRTVWTAGHADTGHTIKNSTQVTVTTT